MAIKSSMGTTRIAFREQDEATQTDDDRNLQTSVDLLGAALGLPGKDTITDTAIERACRLKNFKSGSFCQNRKSLMNLCLGKITKNCASFLNSIARLGPRLDKISSSSESLIRIYECGPRRNPASLRGKPVPSAFKSRRDNDERLELSQTILKEVLDHHHRSFVRRYDGQPLRW